MAVSMCTNTYDFSAIPMSRPYYRAMSSDVDIEDHHQQASQASILKLDFNINFPPVAFHIHNFFHNTVNMDEDDDDLYGGSSVDQKNQQQMKQEDDDEQKMEVSEEEEDDDDSDDVCCVAYIAHVYTYPDRIPCRTSNSHSRNQKAQKQQNRKTRRMLDKSFTAS